MTRLQWDWNESMASGDDREFFAALGQKVAQLRKEHGPTQQQLAEQLGVAPQTLAHYVGARLRVPASMLPQLAQILCVGGGADRPTSQGRARQARALAEVATADGGDCAAVQGSPASSPRCSTRCYSSRHAERTKGRSMRPFL